MARIWKAGGKELRDDQVPFQPGTNEYYRYIATWRAKANGIDYEAPKGFDDDSWKFDKEIEAGKGSAQDYWRAQYDQTKGLDRSGQAAQGYVEVMDPVTGMKRSVYDANGSGGYDPGEGYGKYGGAGNANPAIAIDNRWNDLDGADVRTDEQKFYDRDIDKGSYTQRADEYGNYDWYGVQSFRKADGSTEQKELNLDVLGERAYDGKNGQYSRKDDAAYSGMEMHKYNDAPDANWFNEQVRKRANLSVYGRTA